MRGTNRFLPRDIAVQWCREVPDRFHARAGSRGRRYVYVLRESAIRPALESGLVGWCFRPLDVDAMRAAARHLVGEHDFSAFRSSECQAASPVRVLHKLELRRCGAYWRFEFDANGFLHHMIRNLLGSLVAVGTGARSPGWIRDVLESKDRALAAPTFAPDGLYFGGPYYDPEHELPTQTAATDWLPS